MDVFFPITLLAEYVSYGLLRLDRTSYIGSAVHFFIYDTVKIGILLVVIGYVMAITRYYFPTEQVRRLLTNRRWFGLEFVFAALLGVITPFCSCSSIPLFIGFLGAGIPLGVTFTFLISSPLVNESSLFLFPVMFGMPVTILYTVMGIGIAIIGGIIVSRLHLERYIQQEFLQYTTHSPEKIQHGQSMPLGKLLLYFWKDGMRITKEVFPYVVLGVGVGALIHGFVPTHLVEQYGSIRTWWTVPLVTLIGAPLYANSVSVIPVMEALVEKGVLLGTALAFMTAIVTVSVPEVLMLKKVMRWQLLAVFFGITLFGVMIIGYVFNWIVR